MGTFNFSITDCICLLLFTGMIIFIPVRNQAQKAPDQVLSDMIVPPSEPNLIFNSETDVLNDEPEPALIRSTDPGGIWDEPGTWDIGRVPTRYDTVMISSGTLVTMSGNTQRTTGRLLIEDDAELRGLKNARLAVYLDLQNDGELTHLFDNDQYFIGVQGKTINRGTIRTLDNDFNAQLIELELYGNISNMGIWRGIIELFGENPRNIDLRSAEVYMINRTAELQITGDNYFPDIVGFSETARFIVTTDARLFSKSINSIIFEVFNFIENRGQIINENRVRHVAGFGMDIAASDSINARIISHGNQIPASFALANRRWFRFEPADEPEDIPINQITIFYTATDLRGELPEALEIFYLPEGNGNWEQISNDENRTRELSTFELFGYGALTIQNPPGYGDYVLSVADPYAVRPAVGLYINTLEQIRVGGPPHEAVLTYYNPGTVPLSEGLIEINTGGGVYIEKIIPLGSNGQPVQGIHMGIGDFAFERDSTQALLVTTTLGPHEVRRLRLILQAVPTEDMFPENGITAAPGVFIAGGIAVAVGKDYLKDLLTNGLEEMIADPCANQSGRREQMRAAFDRTDQQWNPFNNIEKPYSSIAENTADAATEGHFGPLKSGINKLNVINQVKDIGNAISSGFDRYEQNTGRSIYEPVNCDPNDPRDPKRRPDRRKVNRGLEPVFSWDPNQKVGPTGAGSGEFLAETGRFYYRIDFENLDEATAPAYRVVIVDTLTAVFDPETVKPEGESHPGFEFTRNGNILRWEIVGIELPPNVNPPEGEGWVAFSVDAVPGQESGTVFENRATIVFDLNPPIFTNTHVNILDNLPPVTEMVPLPDLVVTDTLTIHYSSDDGLNGSGVDNVVVFGSIDGGGFNQVAITETNFARIPVRSGTWTFYALSSDVVGNAEIIQPAVVTTSVVTPTSIGNSGDLPFSWSLGANYPNPFNPVTIIPYSMQQSGEVSITLYDVLGRRVMLLKPGYREMGQHHQELDMRRFASGTYLYEIRVNGAGGLLFRSTEKLMLVK